jgi:hypothetical protein
VAHKILRSAHFLGNQLTDGKEESALSAGHTLSVTKVPGTHFCLPESTQGHNTVTYTTDVW